MFWRKKQAPRYFDREFFLAVGRYGYADKVELCDHHDFGQRTVTIFRVIEREFERDLPLPEPLIQEIQELVQYHFGQETEFKTDRGKKRREILNELESWGKHCKLAWAGYD